MKILSLFDGMSCGMIAFKELGFRIEKYDAYEIDKYAVQTSKHNFPMIYHHGDVFGADFTQYEGYDWVVGGSPCTYWSIAQTRNRETIASGMGWELFSQYVRAIKEAKPKYFLYENNKSMSKQIRQSICDTFGFEPIMINSALVSAQNRQRLYWVGIRQTDGTYKRAEIEQPKDRGILLKDILITEGGQDLTGKDKAFVLTTSYGGACAWNTIERSQRNMVAEPICVNSKIDNVQPSVQDRNYSVGGKMTAVTTSFHPSIAEPVRVGTMPSPDGLLKGGQGMRIYSDEGKAVPITTGKTKTGYYAEKLQVKEATKQGYCEIEVGGCVDLSIPNSKTRRGRKMEDKSNCLQTSNEFYVYLGTTKYPVYEVKDGQITIRGKQYPIKLIDGYYIIRKLTVLECMRLQTVPEWYEFPVSKSQAYKMLGNGWTVEVIKHLITSAYANGEAKEEQLMFEV